MNDLTAKARIRDAVMELFAHAEVLRKWASRYIAILSFRSRVAIRGDNPIANWPDSLMVASTPIEERYGHDSS
jgi:hypothetical protein